MSTKWNANDPSAYTRRRFLGTGLTLASASLTLPAFLSASANAIAQPTPGAASIPGVDEDRVLVVVQLSGGNDGLNTVIPYRDDNYRRVRPIIGLQPDEVQVLSANGHNGATDIALHRSMTGIRSMYDDGLCSIVQGVGYPNPNRSHFKSMDIWQTGDTSGTGDGWLGRYVDAECAGKPGARTNKAFEPPIAIGRTAPLALQGGSVQPVAFETPELFRWVGADVHESLGEPYEKLIGRGDGAATDAGSNAAFLMRTALDARVSSDKIRRAVNEGPMVEYPGSEIGQQLSMIGSMIRAGVRTRVYYASHGGFDTHATQGGANGRHANLLEQWSEAIAAFYQDLEAQGNAERVLTMSFSEFGRRVGQNASGGTDHGTAAPMFLFGPMVRPGVFGDQPSLTDLDEGDLKFKIDFRSVYADVLEHWLSADSAEVLGKKFRATGLVRG